MKLLAEIVIHRRSDDASIQLLQGDLTAIPHEHAVDILVISAYPGSYLPVRNTLLAALYNKGILVGEMAKDKEADLVSQLGCWISKPVSPDLQKIFNFKKILCFEPGTTALEDKAIVSNIFRCINTFAFDNQNNVIAMPVVASGNQKVPLGKMLPAILEAAVFWLENGLPLKCIKLVLYYDKQVEEALPKFNEIKKLYELPKSFDENIFPIPDTITDLEFEKEQDTGDRIFDVEKCSSQDNGSYRSQKERTYGDFYTRSEGDSGTGKPFAQPFEITGMYDFFISYAHKNSGLINSFVQNMKNKNNRLKIFYDKESITAGGLWIKEISDTIQKSRKVLVFLSPDYDNSPVCWDEFQCAKLMEYNRRTSIIQTIYLYNYKAEMPPIMGIYSYIDCREGDVNKLKACIPKIIG